MQRRHAGAARSACEYSQCAYRRCLGYRPMKLANTGLEDHPAWHHMPTHAPHSSTCSLQRDPAMPLIDSPEEFHISIRVADLQQSIAFYTAFLGVAPKTTTARFATFIAPHLK